MKRIAILLCLLASPAGAAVPMPETLVLPTPLVTGLLQYLAQHPYAEVAGLVDAVKSCVKVQVPNENGATIRMAGECPGVEGPAAAKKK